MNYPTLPENTYISVGDMQNLCYDLLLRTDTIEAVLKTYELTEHQFTQIRETEEFQAKIEAAGAHIKALGQNADFKLKCRAIATEGIINMKELLSDSTVDPRVRVDMYTKFVEFADLKPKEERAPTASAVVNFNFGTNIERVVE